MFYYFLISFRWHPGFGDNYLLGWVTVLGYIIAALLTMICAIKVNHTKDKNARWFWWLITFILLFLGINKQLDLQTLLIETGKKASWILGFYDQRRLFQKGFMLGLGIIFLVLFGLTGKALGAEWKKCKLTLLGLCFLMLFVLLRGAMFSRIFYSGYILPHHQWFLEIIGIVLISISAWLNIKRYQQLIVDS